MRKRLRPPHQPHRLIEIYREPHDHRRWGRGHGERVEATIALATCRHDWSSSVVADLSCGNSVIARSLGAKTVILGDLAPGYVITGPIEETIRTIPPVDLFVCSETLEHLDDPSSVLTQIARTTRFLLLSTPLDAWEDTNSEHYWAWSRTDVEAMLAEAGFDLDSFAQVDSRTYGEPYCYGIWLTKTTGSST